MLSPVRRAAVFIGRPASAWRLFNADIALWHVPSLYDLTLRNAGVHYLEHVSFIVLGVLFWVHVFDSPPLRVRLNYTWQLVYVISATDFLGAAAKIANRDYRLVEMYSFVAVVYFVISYSLSLLVKQLQNRIAVIR